MIVFTAKVRCDRRGCDKFYEIEMIMNIDSHDIPSFQRFYDYDNSHDDWGSGPYSDYGKREQHLCPEHKPKK